MSFAHTEIDLNKLKKKGKKLFVLLYLPTGEHIIWKVALLSQLGDSQKLKVIFYQEVLISMILLKN